MRYRSVVDAMLILIVAASCTAARTIPTATLQTNSLKAEPSAGAPIIDLDARSSGPAVAPDAYGASIVTWFDFKQSFVNPSLRKAGIKLVRFPGGSESDAYHWEAAVLCATTWDTSRPAGRSTTS